MSGGVDSSVAAALLVEQGYDVMGLFMRVGAELPEAKGDCTPDPTGRDRQGCCSASDAADARFVAGKLGIPFYALNFKEDFDRLVDEFAAEYARGRTPNPCVVCNERFKFGKLMDYAATVGADCVATGHYARIGERDGQPALLRAVDGHKDQSYVLFGIERALLHRVRFPLGALTKDQVRAAALERGLPVHNKPDSVEICFAPDRDYARVVRERYPDSFIPGDVVDQGGRVLGRHEGLPHYTIGQRRGLGIAAGHPIYVTRLDAAAHTVTVGERNELMRRALLADRVKLLVDAPPGAFRAQAKIRYLHRAAEATVSLLPGGRMRVDFDEPQMAITPGQACVLYDADVVVGGGWIVEAFDPS
jgi:tRNA-uridine 2-sulfurtransferase